jgi:hypothetical protein
MQYLMFRSVVKQNNNRRVLNTQPCITSNIRADHQQTRNHVQNSYEKTIRHCSYHRCLLLGSVSSKPKWEYTEAYTVKALNAMEEKEEGWNVVGFCQRSNQNVPPVVESKCTTRTGLI